MTPVSRRRFLKAGTADCWGRRSSIDLDRANTTPRAAALQLPIDHNSIHGGNVMAGDIDPDQTNLFDPTAMLTDFDYAKSARCPTGRRCANTISSPWTKRSDCAGCVLSPRGAYNDVYPVPRFAPRRRSHPYQFRQWIVASALDPLAWVHLPRWTAWSRCQWAAASPTS